MTGLYYIEVISIVTLSDNFISSTFLDFLHGAKDNLKLIWVEIGEHEGLRDSTLQSVHSGWSFLIVRSLELLFLIPVTKSLSTYRCSWSSTCLSCLDLLDWKVKYIVTL